MAIAKRPSHDHTKRLHWEHVETPNLRSIWSPQWLHRIGLPPSGSF